MPMNGTDVLLLVDTVLLGSQRNLSRDENTAEIDVSSKDGRAGRVLPGRYGSSLTLDALYVPSETAYLALQAANRNGTFVTVVLMEAGLVTESAQAIVTALTETWPDQDAAVISVSLTVDGDWISGS
jgi:hypothetical protein